jgi:prepilin-type N-terminal cleavage/methylation domain-containing protein
VIALSNSRTNLRRTEALPPRGHGFSLVEVAVVLVILAVLLATVAIPIGTQLAQRRVAETQRTLELAQQALLGFAAATGRLPCPATDGVTVGTTNSFGAEAFTSTGTPTNGDCSAWVGYLPAVTLGLSPLDPEGFLLDGWSLKSNRIRYAVVGGDKQKINLIQNPFTSMDGVRNATPASAMNKDTRLLFVCQAAPVGASLPSPSVPATGNEMCGAGVIKLTGQAPGVIYSLGPNAPTGGVSAHELHNVNQDFVFVAHEPTAAGSPNGEFDDIVTWISLPILIDRMQQAGRFQPTP